jgi:hypothetical protein
MKPTAVLDQYALEVRCKLLEVAAVLDRYDRACQAHPELTPEDDPRLVQFRQALAVLHSPQAEANRAEQVAMIYSEHLK